MAKESTIDFDRVNTLFSVIENATKHGKYQAIAQAAFAELGEIDAAERARAEAIRQEAAEKAAAAAAHEAAVRKVEEEKPIAPKPLPERKPIEPTKPDIRRV